MDTSLFDYDLPEGAIAQEAIEPRDGARLLVAKTLEDRTFGDLPDMLDPGDLVVVNSTRVRAARLRALKATGGRADVLLTKHVEGDQWEALVRPARRIRPGTQMTAGPLKMVVQTEPDRGVVVLAVESDGVVDDLLPVVGEVPLPPYFHGTLDDDERYQTMFARNVGSAAAPTAALHFTQRVVDRLVERGVHVAQVELEVGLDTFRPMEDGDITDHVMHRERYTVPEATVSAIGEAKERGSHVVAIGTTVVRTLESAAEGGGGIRAGAGVSELFITPGYRTRIVDAVVTNFHAPKTTLIVMVAALIGPRWKSVYAHALESGYRFLSFGDAMFIEAEQ